MILTENGMHTQNALQLLWKEKNFIIGPLILNANKIKGAHYYLKYTLYSNLSRHAFIHEILKYKPYEPGETTGNIDNTISMRNDPNEELLPTPGFDNSGKFTRICSCLI